MTPFDPFAIALHGAHLVEASAGTGKTYALTTLYLRLLLEQRLPVSAILVVTYTNAATAELRTRIRGRLHEALLAAETGTPDETLQALLRANAEPPERVRRLLTAALAGFDEAAIFTIHGFCQRMLQEHAFESGAPFETQLVTDLTPLRDEVLYDFWSRELHAAPTIFVRYLQRHGVTPESLTDVMRKAVAQPDMPVLPERPARELTSPPCHEHVAVWHSAHVRAAECWASQRDTILALLCAAPGLNKGQYKEATIRTDWAPAMDALLADPVPGLPDQFPRFVRFTTSGLKNATTKNGTPPRHAFFEACEALLQADVALQTDLEAAVVQLRVDGIRYARREVHRRAASAQTQSFDDLLHGLRDALAGPGGKALAAQVRGRFRAALIDEFQDTDPIQYEIFQRIYLGTDAALFLIGDPKQAIYAFRGADVFAYMQAKRDVAHTPPLIINRRSGPRLVRAVNALFARPHAQFVFAEIPFVPALPAGDAVDALGDAADGAAPLQVLFVPRPSSKDKITKEWGKQPLARSVAADIARLLMSAARLHGRGVEPSDLAVLCRTNEQARLMQDALRALRVPSVVQGDASVFDAPDAEELERVLRAVADPSDRRALRAALVTPLMGVDGTTLHALQDDPRGWDEWGERIHRWHQAWLHDGFMPGFRRLLDEHDVHPRLLALTDGERRLTNLLHLGELLQSAAADARLGPRSLVEWLRRMRVDASARGVLAADAAQIRLESDARAVKLVTIHKSKGLEYPIVYCPFLWDGLLLHDPDKAAPRFHDPDDGNRLKLDLTPDDDRLALVEREALAENLRLLYVALTRAKYRCTIVWGRFTDAHTSALGYLLHQPRAAADAELIAATAERIAGLSDADLRADLDALAAAADGGIEIRELSEAPGPLYELPSDVAPALGCRTPRRAVGLGRRTSSFSALVAAAEETTSAPLAVGLDHDAVADAAQTPPALRVAVPVVLHDFPAGAQPGQLIHDILEHVDFASPDRAVLRRVVAERLTRYGVDARWMEPLCQGIDAALDTPLTAGHTAPTLRQIGARQRLNELEFVFPVAADASHALLTAARLAAVFERHAAGAGAAQYAARVRDLGFAPLAGYLRGFIDLVFRHAGRWYVVDYKSNWLGPRPDDYRPARLVEVMAERHYFLQYHLYVVALHRYLAMRLRGYDYERDVGGVYYLFLRGMSPAHPPGCGVFSDRPSRALIDGLSAVLAQPGEGQR